MSSHQPLYRAQTADPASFLGGLPFAHGPTDFLTQYFTVISEAAAQHGIIFSYSTFDELMAINQANLDTWFPITTTYRPDVGGANEENGIVVVGRSANGDPVTCQAVRIFDWSNSTLHREAEALRLFYQDPALNKQPTETCTVTAPVAQRISGQVAYIGGFWIHPDYRGTERLRIVTSVGRASALARWGFDHLISLITPPNVQKKFHARTGVKHVYEGAVIMRNSPSKPGGDLAMSLLLTSPYELIDDLFKLMLEVGPEINGSIRKRHSQ